MHACGHDLHTAMVAGAARLLAARRDALAGDVVFRFQPRRGGHDGARHMIGEGVLEAAGRPLRAACTVHVSSARPRGYRGKALRQTMRIERRSTGIGVHHQQSAVTTAIHVRL
jgi:hippurate hydrolase